MATHRVVQSAKPPGSGPVLMAGGTGPTAAIELDIAATGKITATGSKPASTHVDSKERPRNPSASP